MSIAITMEQLTNQIARLDADKAQVEKDKEFLKGVVSMLLSNDKIFTLVTEYFEMKHDSAKKWFDRNSHAKNTPIYRGTAQMHTNDITTYNRLLSMKKGAIDEQQ